MNYSLVVIDMQTPFLSGFTGVGKSYQTVLNNCKREVVKATHDKANILFVEYNGYGETINDLVSLTRDTACQVKSTIKYDDDGGLEIIKCLKETSPKKIKKIRICGINTDYCVRATVAGLLAICKNTIIEVISDACDSPWEHQTGISILKSISEFNSNLKIK